MAEVFTSIQGESSAAGLACFFIRLAGCNLDCRYCDARHARKKGRRMPVTGLVERARTSAAPLVEITGGEPLLQSGFAELAERLRRLPGKKVLVETNGSLDISVVPRGVRVILDVKCPGSGESERMDLENLDRLRPGDEVKFVISDRADYEWARRLARSAGLPRETNEVLFGPAMPGPDPRRLAGWIVRDGLPVRLQVQLHKLIGCR